MRHVIMSDIRRRTGQRYARSRVARELFDGLMWRTEARDIQRELPPKRTVEYSPISTLN